MTHQAKTCPASPRRMGLDHQGVGWGWREKFMKHMEPHKRCGMMHMSTHMLLVHQREPHNPSNHLQVAVSVVIETRTRRQRESGRVCVSGNEQIVVFIGEFCCEHGQVGPCLSVSIQSASGQGRTSKLLNLPMDPANRQARIATA